MVRSVPLYSRRVRADTVDELAGNENGVDNVDDPV